MKSTRKYLLAVCALAIGFATPVIHAQGNDAPPPPKKEMRGGPVERLLGLKQTLGLTEDQVAQIKKIGEDARAAMKALREKEGDRESKRGEMRKIQEDTKAKVDAVLTAEQKAKLDEIRKNRPKGAGAKGAGGAGGPQGENGPKDGKGPKGPPPVTDDTEM